MRKKNLLTAIDIGTEKIALLTAQLDPTVTDQLQVVGVSVIPSQGIKKSQIVDLEKVIASLTQALDAAERMAGSNISSAFVSIAGAQIDSLNSKGVVAVASPKQEIMSDDVTRVIEAARAVSIPPGKEILHIIPRDFAVDSQHGIKDPTGMTGIRLESEAHIVTATSTSLKNLSKCLNDVGIIVDGFVFSGLAAAKSSLTETEKELGVALVDIGAGTTSVTVYVESSLAASFTLPVGARHITQGIALGCRLSLEAAEKVKTELSNHPPETVVPQAGESKEGLKKRREKENELNLKTLGIDEGVETLTKKTIIEGIMVPRMKEIFTLLVKELRERKLLNEIPAGTVLTGGGAETVAITEIAKRTLNLPSRIGRPISLKGVTHDLNGPEFSTVVGTLLYGQEQGTHLNTTGGFKLPELNFKLKLNLGGITSQIQKFIKSLLP